MTLSLLGLGLLLLSGAGAGMTLGKKAALRAENGALLARFLLFFRERFPLPLAHAAEAFRLDAHTLSEEGASFLSALAAGEDFSSALALLPLPESVRKRAELLTSALYERSRERLALALSEALSGENALPALAEAAFKRAKEDSRLLPLLLPSLLLALSLLFL